FTEGYVLAREEQARATAQAAHLASLVPRRIAEGVELLVIAGPYDPLDLSASLETWVRDAFRAGVKVAILDLLGAVDAESHGRALRETCLVLGSLGVETIVVGAPLDLVLPADAKRAAGFDDALSRALSGRDLSSFAMARVRRLFTRSSD